jgi:dolichyl-phosphate-mannose--protein O-mannosyl transferase
MFGLGAASKWIVLYGGVGLAVLYFLGLFWKCRDWPGGEDAPSKPRWLAGTLLFSVVCFVVLPGAIYLASYLPIAYADKVTGWKDFWSLVWNNQVFMLTYHKGVDTPHPYSSRWYQWLLDIRPILYYMVNETEAGFTTRFAAFNSPVVAWGGLAALVVTAVQTVRRRCGKGLLILVGYLAQLLPWVFISRITFAYHYFPCILFLSLALAFVFNDLVESGRRWRGAVYGLTGTAAGLYALFYPALIGLRVPTWFMKCFIKWFPSWPF